MKQQHPIIEDLVNGIEFTGELQVDIRAFLKHHGHINTAVHCLAVAKETRELARKYGEDEEAEVSSPSPSLRAGQATCPAVALAKEEAI